MNKDKEFFSYGRKCDNYTKHHLSGLPNCWKPLPALHYTSSFPQILRSPGSPAVGRTNCQPPALSQGIPKYGIFVMYTQDTLQPSKCKGKHR